MKHEIAGVEDLYQWVDLKLSMGVNQGYCGIDGVEFLMKSYLKNETTGILTLVIVPKLEDAQILRNQGMCTIASKEHVIWNEASQESIEELKYPICKDRDKLYKMVTMTQNYFENIENFEEDIKNDTSMLSEITSVFMIDDGTQNIEKYLLNKKVLDKMPKCVQFISIHEVSKMTTGGILRSNGLNDLRFKIKQKSNATKMKSGQRAIQIEESYYDDMDQDIGNQLSAPHRFSQGSSSMFL